MHSGQMRQSEEEVDGSLGGFRAQPTRLASIAGKFCHRLFALAFAPKSGDDGIPVARDLLQGTCRLEG